MNKFPLTKVVLDNFEWEDYHAERIDKAQTERKYQLVEVLSNEGPRWDEEEAYMNDEREYMDGIPSIYG